MVRVHNRGEGFRVELTCHICDQRLLLRETWLAFPTHGEEVPGVFVHDVCVRGKMRVVLGVQEATLMRGHVALVRLAESLQGPMAIERSHEQEGVTR
jgi:hypothetical protein